jgi:hypothetical protein
MYCLQTFSVLQKAQNTNKFGCHQKSKINPHLRECSGQPSKKKKLPQQRNSRLFGLMPLLESMGNIFSSKKHDLVLGITRRKNPKDRALACCNVMLLACEERNRMSMISKEGLLSTLVLVMDTDDCDQAREFACGTIMALTVDTVHAEKVQSHPGLLESLVKSLADQQADKTRQFACGTLRNMTTVKEARIQLPLISDSLRILTECLERDRVPKTREHAAVVLTNLAYEERNVPLILEAKGLVAALVSRIEVDSSQEVQEWCIAALRNLSLGSTVGRMKLFDCEELMHNVLEAISRDDLSDEVRADACSILCNLAESEEIAPLLVETQWVMDVITDMIESGKQLLRVYVVHILLNLLLTTASRHYVVSNCQSRVMGLLTQHITSSDNFALMCKFCIAQLIEVPLDPKDPRAMSNILSVAGLHQMVAALDAAVDGRKYLKMDWNIRNISAFHRLSENPSYIRSLTHAKVVPVLLSYIAAFLRDPPDQTEERILTTPSEHTLLDASMSNILNGDTIALPQITMKILMMTLESLWNLLSSDNFGRASGAFDLGHIFNEQQVQGRSMRELLLEVRKKLGGIKIPPFNPITSPHLAREQEYLVRSTTTIDHLNRLVTRTSNIIDVATPTPFVAKSDLPLPSSVASAVLLSRTNTGDTSARDMERLMQKVGMAGSPISPTAASSKKHKQQYPNLLLTQPSELDSKTMQFLTSMSSDLKTETIDPKTLQFLTSMSSDLRSESMDPGALHFLTTLESEDSQMSEPSSRQNSDSTYKIMPGAPSTFISSHHSGRNKNMSSSQNSNASTSDAAIPINNNTNHTNMIMITPPDSIPEDTLAAPMSYEDLEIDMVDYDVYKAPDRVQSSTYSIPDVSELVEGVSMS